MTTATATAPGLAKQGTTRPVDRPDGFRSVESKQSLGYNVPQRVGTRLWLPMFALALIGWTVGIALAIAEASTARDDLDTLQNLEQLIPGFMFIGFLGVFSSITFAIARILGEFRRGGGEVQETAGSEVQTLKMPGSAKAMLGFMMMGMMVMVAGIVANFVGAAAFTGVATDVSDNASTAVAAAGLRRMGVALYLTGITFGLGTIIEVLRFQSIRIREVASAHGHNHN